MRVLVSLYKKFVLLYIVFGTLYSHVLVITIQFISLMKLFNIKISGKDNEGLL